MTAPAVIGADRAAWRGVLADVSVVTVTPFTADGAVDLNGLRANVRYVLDAGARLLVAGGNTGEVWSLSDDEVMAVVAAHADVAAGRATVIAGVTGRPDAIAALAPRLRDAGADALMVHQPPNPYAGDRGLAAYYGQIARTTGPPLIAYVRSPAFASEAAAALQTTDAWVGVKYAVPNPVAFGRLKDHAPSLGWVCGLAESWVPPFADAGAIGFTSGLANVAPERSLALLSALRDGDRAAALAHWHAIQPFEALRARRGEANNVAVVKAALDLIGLHGGPVRPPLEDLPPADRVELQGILRSWGLTV